MMRPIIRPLPLQVVTPLLSFSTLNPELQVVHVDVELQDWQFSKQAVQLAVVLKNPSEQVVHSVLVTQTLHPLLQLVHVGGVR